MRMAVALDSCVVIRLMEQPGLGRRLKAKIRGTYTHIVIPDTVLGEVRRVRGHSAQLIRSKMASILGRRVLVAATNDQHRARARDLSSRYAMCHSGDDLIVALCGAHDLTLVTLDRMMLQTCEFAGIPAFHPFRRGSF